MRSLRTKFIVFCLMLLAIPSLIIGTIGFQLSKQHLDQSGQIQLKNDVRLVIGMITVLNKEVKKGTLSPQEAKERVKVYILGEKNKEGQRPINKNIAIGENGYFFIMDDKGRELAHPKIEGKIGIKDAVGNDVLDLENKKPVAEAIIEKAKNGGGYTYYDWQLPNNSNKIAPKIAYSEQDPYWGWVVCAGSYMMDFNQGANQVLYLLLITLGTSLLIGAILVWLVVKRITNPIIWMANQVEKVTEGDLTVETINVKTKDEIGQLAQGFNTMMNHLRHLIDQVSNTAVQVASSSEELNAGAEQTSKATAQISSTMQELAVGSESQANSVDESFKVINEISEGIRQILARSQNASTTFTCAINRAVEGNQAIQTAIQQMNSINHTVSGLSIEVKGLGEHSQEIGKIVEVITGIAAQTHLLALNAAIEAARAGEQGRGFSVVANEVHKLAKQTAESAEEIAHLISTIQIKTNNVVQSMEITAKEVIEGISVVNTASQSFEQIQHSVNEASTQIKEVSVKVEQISVGTEWVVNSIQPVAEIAAQATLGTQQVASAVEEQLASMEEISLSASLLSKMSEELKLQIWRFKV